MSSKNELKCTYTNCCMCKKPISWQTYQRDGYAYRKSLNGHMKYTCSWSCFNKMLNKYDKPKKKSNYARVIDLMAQGLSDEEIAKNTGLALLTVKVYISKSDCYA